jgi:heat shock protein HslJ
MKSFRVYTDWRRAFCAAILLVALASSLHSVAVAEESFPFNEELLLDARPMPGSKRIPSLDIRADGEVTIDLWCDSVQGQLVVAENTITVLTGLRTRQSCTPDREQADADLLSALEQTTTWRRDGGGVVLIGPQTLRFHPPTN